VVVCLHDLRFSATRNPLTCTNAGRSSSRCLRAAEVRPEEMRERAIRFALDPVEGPEKLSVNAACKRVGGQLGIVPDTLRNWVKQTRVDAGDEPGLTTDERTRLRELEKENRELRRANAILKSASAFFAAERSSRPGRTAAARGRRTWSIGTSRRRTGSAGRLHLRPDLGRHGVHAFVSDASSRRIVGWRTANRMPTELPLDALEMAL
jgi:transposase